jgi:jumonji domain-containing protein 7
VESTETRNNDAVFYYSRQNDCLRSDLSTIWKSCIFPESIDWAEEAFNVGPPDAVNLWIGDERATSAMHKDHYENLFYVLTGEKVFTVCPPADAPFLCEQQCQSGKFSFSSNDKTWRVKQDFDEDMPATVRWIASDVTEKDNPDHLQEFPLLRYAHPIEIRVKAGEMLYLPSLWFHRVTQTCETIGVNYWYDMKFDSPNWCYFHLLQQLRLSSDGNNTDDDKAM